MQCHLLSFEGPDAYAEAGGLASRIHGLSDALVGAGFETHLWFVGDPHLAGYEVRGALHLHRWCQWISRYHPAGVYDGEEGKRADYAASLPPFLVDRFLRPAIERGEQVLVMAEEWHTVDALLHLDWLLQSAALRQKVALLWNANNTFGFQRIDWQRLRNSAMITTVSRYMKGLMQGFGVEPIVISNGLPKEAYVLPRRRSVDGLRSRLAGRSIFTKVARWDPAKRWEQALKIVKAAKDCGWRPLLIARGGQEPYRGQVRRLADDMKLKWSDRALSCAHENSLLDACSDLEHIDILSLATPIDASVRALLFAGSDAVLANSAHEPFGLVGLEAMAAEGVACIGNTGEDYAIPGYNALVIDSADPREFINLFRALKADRARERALRRAARRTAQQYAWPKILERVTLPKINVLTRPQLVLADIPLFPNAETASVA
jgi:glycosyltransferase involved in cell wall biosynthesis